MNCRAARQEACPLCPRKLPRLSPTDAVACRDDTRASASFALQYRDQRRNKHHDKGQKSQANRKATVADMLDRKLPKLRRRRLVAATNKRRVRKRRRRSCFDRAGCASHGGAGCCGGYRRSIRKIPAKMAVPMTERMA
jgi:hypothetical protein